MELAEKVYRLSSRFPRDEVYGMTSQLRRSAVSVAANIAEGHGRENSGVFIQFLRVAQGSLKELETHLLLAVRVGLLADGEATLSLDQANDVGKMLRSLIRSIQRRQADV